MVGEGIVSLLAWPCDRSAFVGAVRVLISLRVFGMGVLRGDNFWVTLPSN